MKKFTDTVAAETKSIGFDFQYYFFLWKLLSLQKGETVGLECKDDVHTELNDSQQILYQIKHSLQKNATGDVVNLTSLDSDLWKTLSNWIKIITDKNDNRSTPDKQLAFIKKTTFVLASNKSHSSENEIIKLVENIENQTDKQKTIKDCINSQLEKTKNEDIRAYITTVLNVSDDVLCAFISKITFELDEDDIFEKCMDAIKSDKIPEDKIKDVFANVDSAIRKDNFIKIKNGEKISISFDEFYLKYRKLYDSARTGCIQIRTFDYSKPNKINEQTFIKQLIEIGDTQPDEMEQMALLSTHKLMFTRNAEEWINTGELTNNELDTFFEEAITEWSRIFRKKYRGISSSLEYNLIGLDILDEVRENKLHLDNQHLGTRLSNGCYYKLSDMPKIGWRKDWEKYKK